MNNKVKSGKKKEVVVKEDLRVVAKEDTSFLTVASKSTRRAEIRKYESYMAEKSKLDWSHYFEEANRLNSVDFRDRSFSSIYPNARNSNLPSARSSKQPSGKSTKQSITRYSPLPPRPIAT
jgi:hypothetical protein